MSTQLDFDLAGLLGAVERDDLDYQLALYAADAELRVAQPDPHRSVSVYHGRDQIRAWLQRPDLDQVTHRMGNLSTSDGGIVLTDVIRHRDGRHVICLSTLRLDHGQIVDQDVTLVQEQELDRHPEEISWSTRMTRAR
jgi:hypothetical protein